jgi:hypothetical protein
MTARTKSLEYLQAILAERRRVTADTVNALVSSPRVGSTLDAAGEARMWLLEGVGVCEVLRMDCEVEGQVDVMRGSLRKCRDWASELNHFVLVQVGPLVAVVARRWRASVSTVSKNLVVEIVVD